MQRLRRPFLEWLCNFGLAPSVSIAQLVLASVFERYPNLKIFFAETRLGWVPFWLQHLGLWGRRPLGWAPRYLGFPPADGAAQPLCPRARLFQRAVRAGRDRGAAPCRCRLAGRQPHPIGFAPWAAVRRPQATARNAGASSRPQRAARLRRALASPRRRGSR